MEIPISEDNFNLNEIDEVLYNMEHIQPPLSNYLASDKQTPYDPSLQSGFHLNFSKDDNHHQNYLNPYNHFVPSNQFNNQSSYFHEERVDDIRSNIDPSLLNDKNTGFFEELPPPRSIVIESDLENRNLNFEKNNSFYLGDGWKALCSDSEATKTKKTGKSFISSFREEKGFNRKKEKKEPEKKIYSIDEVKKLFRELQINIKDEKVFNNVDNDVVNQMAKKLKQIRLRNIKRIFSVGKLSKQTNKGKKRRYVKTTSINDSGPIRKRIRKLKKIMQRTGGTLDLNRSLSGSQTSKHSLLKSPKINQNNRTVSLLNVLEKIFSAENFGENCLSLLDKEKREIVIGHLKQKFVIDDYEVITGVKKSKQRNEDSFKLIVKRALKKLIKRFKSSNTSKKITKLEHEISFYENFFGETAKQLNLPISFFYLPGSKINETAKDDIKADKTVSYAYMSRILSSEKFRVVFVDYVLYEFEEEYQIFRRERLEKLAKAIEEEGKGVKLPWTKGEVLGAQKAVLDIIQEQTN